MDPVAQNLPLASAPVFDLVQARRMADYARRAYLINPCAELDGGALACSLIEDAETDTQVYMEDTGDAVVLAFRGTKDLKNWLLDADYFKQSIPSGVSVHRGFLRAADALLLKIIEKLNGNSKPLVILGHSLGGALATLTAFAFQKNNYAIRAVWTFGSPRVGNAAFRFAYDTGLQDKTFRVVCAGDLVPLVPGLLDGFRHVGTEIFLDGHRRLICPSHIWETLLDSWRVFWALKRRDWDFIFRFHSIEDDYMASLA